MENKNLHVSQRMKQLMKPIEQQIMMCDDREDMLMLACGMLQRTREIFDLTLGPRGRMKMFEEYTKDEGIH